MNISKINNIDDIESSLEGNQTILQGGFCEFFTHRHFQYDIIIWAVGWYCKYGISYCELEEMPCE
jgi:hypothetical protein